MLKNISLVKNRKMSMLIVLMIVIALTFAICQGAFAYNAPGDKAINFSGYSVTSGTYNGHSYNFKLYFDKNCAGCLASGYFRLWDETSSHWETVTYADNYSSDKPTAASWYPTGTCVYLNISSLDANHTYRMTVSHTLYANNNFTIGGLTGNEDFVFEFQVPDGNGAYTGTPKVNVYPADSPTGWAWEPNAIFVSDRPMHTDPSNTGYFKRYVSGNWIESLDSTFDSNTDPSYYAYTRQLMENTNNTWYYPETAGGTASVSYNLNTASNNASVNYDLLLPYMAPIGDNTYVNTYTGYGNYTFTVSRYDVPGKILQPTVSTGDATGEIDITFSKTSSTTYPCAQDYYFYVNSDRYFFNDSEMYAGSVSSSADTVSTTITGLDAGETYCVCVVPYISSGYGNGPFSVPSTPVQAGS